MVLCGIGRMINFAASIKDATLIWEKAYFEIMINWIS